jgi:hypothetical protein
VLVPTLSVSIYKLYVCGPFQTLPNLHTPLKYVVFHAYRDWRDRMLNTGSPGNPGYHCVGSNFSNQHGELVGGRLGYDLQVIIWDRICMWQTFNQLKWTFSTLVIGLARNAFPYEGPESENDF